MSNGTQRQKYSNLTAERVNVEKKLLDLLKQYYASVGGGLDLPATEPSPEKSRAHLYLK